MSPEPHRVRDAILATAAVVAALVMVLWSVGSSVDREVAQAVERVGEGTGISPQ